MQSLVFAKVEFVNSRKSRNLSKLNIFLRCLPEFCDLSNCTNMSSKSSSLPETLEYVMPCANGLRFTFYIVQGLKIIVFVHIMVAFICNSVEHICQYNDEYHLFAI